MRLSAILVIGCVAPMIAVAAASCGSENSGIVNAVAGAGGSAAGSGGASAGGSGGAIGGSGGSGGAMAGGAAGMPGAGGALTGGASGAVGAGGAVVVDGGPYSCEGTKPAAALITDFAAVDTAKAFTSTGGYSGRIFTYGAGMVPTLTPALSMTGTVSGYTGLGIYLTQCVDASAYGGISFTIGGNVGTTGKLMLQAKTNSTTPISNDTKHGTCVPADPTNTYATCWDPVAWVIMPETAATVTVRWSEFVGGKPVATVNPAEILGFQWSFDWAGATGVAYAANVTIDDITFVQ
jgi:hypothetical protein